jgi:glyoxylase-like metal-dependent hydrolase (beta-lactamase superfamily II)
LAVPCFLIRHPQGDLVWDTGLEDTLADEAGGVKSGVWHYKLEHKLPTQLAKIGLKPSDIDYLSISHLHPEHTGNANLFAESTFIVNEDEHAYMFSKDIKPVFGSYYTKLEQAKTVLYKERHDIFGDGKVIMHSMPGHTPGSAVLLIKLQESGSFILSGDLYVHRKGYELKSIPTSNTDKTATLASRRKLELLAAKENARIIIQHDRQDFNSLPAFPQFLD